MHESGIVVVDDYIHVIHNKITGTVAWCGAGRISRRVGGFDASDPRACPACAGDLQASGPDSLRLATDTGAKAGARGRRLPRGAGRAAVRPPVAGWMVSQLHAVSVVRPTVPGPLVAAHLRQALQEAIATHSPVLVLDLRDAPAVEASAGEVIAEGSRLAARSCQTIYVVNASAAACAEISRHASSVVTYLAPSPESATGAA